MNKRIVCLLVFLGCLSASFVAPVYAQEQKTARAEIEQLLERLEKSGCQFNRNGSWHTSAEAKQHLLSKLEYLEKKKQAQSSEQFIELAATKSSMSGQAYQVRCANKASVNSSLWLSTELVVLRQKK
jgi:hypothetical protein